MTAFSHRLYAAWFVALIATLGSLFFSEIMGFVPCSLCWYQRIFMYPAALLLTIAVFKRDGSVTHHVLPLVAVGWFFSIYHNLVQWGVISESLSPCRSGIPCSAKYVEYLGFITIPFMSLVAFSLMAGILCLGRKST